MKFLVFAPKGKSMSLTSKPQDLENCPALGSRTALFFEYFVRKRQKSQRKFAKTFFVFLLWRSPVENTYACVLGLGFEHSCFWPLESLPSEGLSLALVSVFLGGPWPRALCPQHHLYFLNEKSGGFTNLYFKFLYLKFVLLL